MEKSKVDLKKIRSEMSSVGRVGGKKRSRVGLEKSSEEQGQFGEKERRAALEKRRGKNKGGLEKRKEKMGNIGVERREKEKSLAGLGDERSGTGHSVRKVGGESKGMTRDRV